MNKLVYLFELDSVRKTDEEIHKGHLAMYDELIGNGNTIAMSMNQITDSLTFLCMLQDDDHYDIIKKLFDNGYIRISRYGEIRTPSQYLQNAINRNLEKSNDLFIFSSIPVKSNQKLLLKLMQKALVNADISLIRECINLPVECNKKVVELFNEYNSDGTIRENTIDVNKAKEYLTFLYRFLELIIKISMKDELLIPAIKYDETYKQQNFSDIMNEIISFKCDKNEFKLWDESIDVLKGIKGDILKNLENKINNRSVWIKKIKTLEKSEDKDSFQYAELIVNLCYNYTVELSIYGVSRHYERDGNIDIDSFRKEFFSRLKYEWNNEEKEDEKIDWKRGLRVLLRRKNKKHKENKGCFENNSEKVPLYEFNYNNQRKEKKKHDIINIFKALIMTSINIVLLYFTDSIASLLQDYINPFFKSVITFFIIASFNEVISESSGFPNILECLKIIVESVTDLSIIVKQKTNAYVNRGNLNNDYTEEIPETLKFMFEKTKLLQPTVQEGAVVVVPIYKDKFILLNQFRDTIRENQLAFPRGYGDRDKNGNSINAVKEIKKELGVEIIGRPLKLGSIIANSGISANRAMVYVIKIDKYKEKIGYEGIKNIELKTKEELISSIINGEINDAYTLAAYTLYVNNGVLK